MPTTTTLPSPSLDLELSPLPGQMGFAILNVQGIEVKSHQFSLEDSKLLFQMLLVWNTTTSTTTTTPLQRLVVTFSTCRYLVTREEHYIYIVQTKLRTT